MTEPNPSVEDHENAWAGYIKARLRADKTLADDRKQVVAHRPRNVVIFPVHKTRQSGLIPGGGAQ